jgi:hypothetical protein
VDGKRAAMNRRKFVATLAKSKPDASADQVQRFERKLREVKQAVASLPGNEYHAELLNLVRRAGWTTTAEAIFFEALTDSILAQTRDLQQLHQKLKAAFEAVQGQ